MTPLDISASNDDLWTIVLVLAIVALVIFILSAFSGWWRRP